MNNKIYSFIYKLTDKLNNTAFFAAVRQGFTYMIPFVLIGSFALMLKSMPVQMYQNAMTYVFGPDWGNFFLYIRDGTYNIMSLLLALCFSYSYAVEKNKNNINPITAGLVSLGSFIAISGISKPKFKMSNFGVTGIFIALLVTVVSSMIFCKLCNVNIFKVKFYSNGANSNFNNALTSIFPAMITIAIFAALNQILTIFFNISDIQVFFSDSLFILFTNIVGTFWKGLLFIILIHIFWFFGIHGSNMLEPVALSVFTSAITINHQLIASGKVPTEIFTKTFFDTFVLMGGCGTGLCFILAILITGKRMEQNYLSKISFIPVLFNINELMVFGIPMVMNPVYFIPFIFVPLILTVISYLATLIGFVPYTINSVEWTTPVFLSGYISTGSIKGSILQLVNLTVGTICYIPFVKLSKKINDMQLKNNMAKVYEDYSKAEEAQTVPMLFEKHDNTSRILKSLIADLELDLQKNNINMFYQPISDYNGKVIYIEALLRWKHGNYGYIKPSIIIGLAEEAGLITKLGYHIIDKSCSDLHAINGLGISNIIMSVNISASQLEDKNFAGNLCEIIHKHGIDPKNLLIEITEGVTLSNNECILTQIKLIKELGVGLAMDDFGMGHSSLIYLKEYNFDVVKLDGSLVREIISNKNCRDIVSSIISLGKSLDFTVIAEFVESPEQKEVLKRLNCGLYQGYLFSPAIPCKDIIEYITKNKN